MTTTEHDPRPIGAQALARFELACPFVVGNPFVAHFPWPKQQRLLGAHLWDRRAPVFECLFGGSAGGGKSEALLAAAGQYAWRFPHFRGLLLRRTRTELTKAGALLDRAMRWWLPAGVEWSAKNATFTFPGGATVEMGYHAGPRDDGQFQGTEYHFVGFDELTHWPTSSAHEWLRSRIRKNENDPIPLRLLATSNPGGPGHAWVKARFVGGTDAATGRMLVPERLYIPATIDDNPALNREAYKETLRGLHPTRVAQLLEGDWTARDPGDYFRVEWFGPLLDPVLDALPRDVVEVRWWDLAASENRDAARTAGVRMARLRAGVRAVVHATAFRATPGKRDDRIVQQAHADGRGVVVGLEIEGGSGGPAQYETIAKRLRAEGFRVVGARPRVGNELTAAEKPLLVRNSTELRGKEGRADPVASCLERGYQYRGECPDTGSNAWGTLAKVELAEQSDGLRLFAGVWTQEYLDELEGFPDGPTVDLVDATSGAWAWLEAHPYGLQVASAPRIAHQRAELADVHPEDRGGRLPGGGREAGDGETGRDRAGRWRP